MKDRIVLQSGRSVNYAERPLRIPKQWTRASHQAGGNLQSGSIQFEIGLDRESDLAHRLVMSRAVISLLILVYMTMAASAEKRPQGLMWNRSGLASTLPLQVKTATGADYLLRLRDVETRKFVLAAYIRGGEFFRVLVPPGWYELLFAFGTNWQGEDALFGPDTQYLVLDRPLRFGATVSSKRGHLVDLRAEGKSFVRDFALCHQLSPRPEILQRPLRWAGTPLRYPLFPSVRLGVRRSDHGGVLFRDPRFRVDKLIEWPYPDPFLMTEYFRSRYDLRSRVCD